MAAGFLTVLCPTVITTVQSGFAAAAQNAATLGVYAMGASLITVPVISCFTKKFDDKHISAVFKD